ncbi:MAG: ribosome maturation factor RimP [Cyanobacteria bacterium J06636_16]
MTHPLIPKVIDLAAPLAESLGLDVVDAVFQTNHSPPVLRIDVRNCQQEDTSLEDCEHMSQALEAALDETELLPDAYVLEVSSPGISSLLSSERDFIAFKGFMVEVTLTEPYKSRQTWLGQLVRRDEDVLHLSRKGRPIKLPRSLVDVVKLSDQPPD